jgi:tRNA pseudouridine55 synthase
MLVNKPEGPTSHDVVEKLREITGIQKIGHIGTLDPAAEGLLGLLVGRKATKKQNSFQGLDKEYKAAIRLGISTDTYDKKGAVQEVYSGPLPKTEKVKTALSKFEGTFKQVPPPFSAKKINGEKAYELAREGKEFELDPVEITIYKIDLLEYEEPILKIKVDCSKGTYIRSLASDLGEELNCGAYLGALKRTKIGDYLLEEAMALEKLNEKNWKKNLKEI